MMTGEERVREIVDNEMRYIRSNIIGGLPEDAKTASLQICAEVTTRIAQHVSQMLEFKVASMCKGCPRG